MSIFRRPRGARRLLDQREDSMIERLSRRGLFQRQAFARPLTGMLQRPMMAVRIVPAPAEEDVRRPGAAAAAQLGVVARAAVSPQRLDGNGSALPRIDCQRRSPSQNFSQRMLADIPTGISRGRQRRTAFDGPVRFNPQRIDPGLAALPDGFAPLRIAKPPLVRTVVADVVARVEQQPVAAGPGRQLIE